jgi:hypothetical protein
MVPPPNLDDLSHTELKNLVVALFEQLAELERTNAALRDEIARLKGGPRRPNIKPSGMDQATEPKPDKPAGEGGGKRGSTKTKLTIHEEKTVKVDAPAGSRFKGYTSYLVQDLIIRANVVNFRCERWLTPDGTLLTAPLPDGIQGHFGARVAPVCPRSVPSGTGHGPTTGGDIAGARYLHLQTTGCPPVDQWPGSVPQRSSRCAAGWALERRLDHSRRHGGSPQSHQWILHPNRQRALCLVRDDEFEEPRQFPWAATGRPRGLRYQRRGAGLYARAPVG